MGFLFGQLFFGHFSIAATLAGVGGLVCSIAALRMAAQSRWAPAWLAWACGVALLGVALDAGNYYLHEDISGNYYAWFLIGPFAAGLVLIAFTVRRRRAALVDTWA